MSEVKKSRREFLKYTGGLAAAAAVGAGVAVYTINSNQSQTSTVTRSPLRLWSMETDPEQGDSLKAINRDYTALNPNVTIELESVGLSDIYTRTISAIGTGSVPDVTTTDDLRSVSLQAQANIFADLSDVLEKVRGGKSDLWPASQRVVAPQGEVLQLPYDNNIEIVWYRKDLFEQKGLRPPNTWEDELAAAETLTLDTDGDGKTNIYGIAMPLGRSVMGSNWILERMLSNGAVLWDDELTVVLDQAPNLERTVETLEYSKKLWKFAPPGASSYSFAEMNNAIVTEAVAMTTGGGRQMGLVEKNNPNLYPKLGTNIIPHGPSGDNKTFMWTEGFAVFKNGKYVEQAKKYLEWFMNGDAIVRFELSLPVFMFPPWRSVFNSKEWKENPRVEKWSFVTQTDVSALENQTYPYGFLGPSKKLNPNAAAVIESHILVDMLQAVVLSDTKPDLAVKDAASRIRKIMRQ